jgi:predicted nucleotidyltransferase
MRSPSILGSDDRVAPVRSSKEALGRLEAHQRRWVEELRDRLRALLGDRLRDLRLFGSHARRQAHDESDIDLLVLVDRLDEETVEDFER